MLSLWESWAELSVFLVIVVMRSGVVVGSTLCSIHLKINIQGMWFLTWLSSLSVQYFRPKLSVYRSSIALAWTPLVFSSIESNKMIVFYIYERRRLSDYYNEILVLKHPSEWSVCVKKLVRYPTLSCKCMETPYFSASLRCVVYDNIHNAPRALGTQMSHNLFS